MITTRIATLADLDVVAELFDAYRRFYLQPSDLGLAKSFLTARLRNKESVVILAINAAHEVVGFCQLYPTFCSVEAKPIYTLYDLFVAPAERRSGAGSILLRAAEKLAAANGMARMDLTTARSNKPAQATYEALGWVRDEVFFAYSKRVEAQPLVQSDALRQATSAPSAASGTFSSTEPRRPAEARVSTRTSSAHVKLQYFLRAPKFPVIVDFRSHLIGIESRDKCSKVLLGASHPDTAEQFDVIDSNAENFSFHPRMSAISVLAIKKRWTKSALVALYNSRRTPDTPAYEPRSLGNKRFDQVLLDVVRLLDER